MLYELSYRPLDVVFHFYLVQCISTTRSGIYYLKQYYISTRSVKTIFEHLFYWQKSQCKYYFIGAACITLLELLVVLLLLLETCIDTDIGQRKTTIFLFIYFSFFQKECISKAYAICIQQSCILIQQIAMLSTQLQLQLQLYIHRSIDL